MLNDLTLSNERRFRWLDCYDPAKAMTALQEVFDVSPWAWGGESILRDSWYTNRHMHNWFNNEHVPMVSEELTPTNKRNDPGVTPMTEVKNPLAKSIAYAERHALREKITRAENNTIQSADDLFEVTAAMDAGLTMDQVKKLDKARGELLPAALMIGGELAEEAFRADPNLSETGMSFNMGSHQKFSAIFHRDGPSHVTAVVETTHRSAEYDRVHKHLNGLFESINN